MLPPSRAEARRLAGSTLLVGFDGTTPPPELLGRLAAGEIAGVVLFRRNIRDAAQLRALTAKLYDAAALSPIVAVDQEGGRVARLRGEVISLPPMRTLGSLEDPSLTRSAARILGEELSALGINLNFAPVCDVDSNPDNPVIGDRSFGRDPHTVARHAAAFIEGMQAAGVAACAKHFPGHGDTDTDSHLELPSLRHDRARLDAVELPPFRAALEARVATLMTAHVRFDAIDPERPATLSKPVLDALLQNEFGGPAAATVVVSDDLLMKAVSARWSPDAAALLAVEAGCDLLLVCDDLAAQGRCVDALAEEAMRRGIFRARLVAAAAKVSALRARWPMRPPSGWPPHSTLFARPERLALEARLRDAMDHASRPDPTER